jgi:hypothetical protein
MIRTVLGTLLAPALIGVSWMVARRHGQRLGGLVSAFPAIAGPFLLLIGIEHGSRFAANAAAGTLAGLLAFGGFAIAYGRAAPHFGWRRSLALAWAVAAALAAIVQWLAPGPPLGLVLAIASLLIARGLLPTAATPAAAPASSGVETLRAMALGALLVCSLALGAAWLGPEAGGVLAGLPVIAAVLASETHRRSGVLTLHALLRGMLDGMVSFVLFCEIVATLAVPAGIAFAFATASVAAAAAQATLFYVAGRAGGTGHRHSGSPA